MAAPTNDLEKYEVLEKIGHGSFGLIHKVKRKTDSKILCRKEIEYVRMSQKEREQLHAEFSILSSLRHPNIVAYYHREHLKPRQELHLYMEYCGGGDLGRYIKTLKKKKELAPEPYVWSVLSQLVTALYRCHNGEDPPEVGNNVMLPPKNKPSGLLSKNKVVILHRDLKPENVFLDDEEQVKLGDFGLSKLIQSNDFASTYVGTPYYMSPEICAAEKYGTHSDIWSLGCIIYELCSGCPPFDARTHYELVQKIKLGRVAPLPEVYSPELQNLIKSCLNVNPQRRPDTWALIQMPVIRLMRKEREVVELGNMVRSQQMQGKMKVDEAVAQLANLENDKKRYRAELEATLRREWEVKARLEIDRQVALEKERLIKMYDEAVRLEVERRLEAMAAEKENSPQVQPGSSSPKEAPLPRLSQASTATAESNGPATEISSLSLSSPTTNPSLLSAGPAVRKMRTPGLARAATTNHIVDSPADVHMASPSPMSIASLALSPRRAAALTQGVPTGNIFASDALNQNGFRPRWQPQQLSPMTSEGERSPGPCLEDSDEDDDGVPELPSPTRMPRAGAMADPFKAPRPGMKRQMTAPAHRMGQPAQPLFSTAGNGQPTSPTRIRVPMRKANTAVGGEDMLKAVHARNMRENTFVPVAPAVPTNAVPSTSGLSGRTLVELNQGRAIPALSAPSGISVKVTGEKVGAGMGLEEVARWDPEVTPESEMPSPFIKRTRKGLGVAR